MANLWLFGDSFTQGFPEDQNELFWTPEGVTLKWDDDAYKVRNWGEKLKTLLNYDNVINVARGGCSNYVILSKLIEYLNDIQPDDTIIIGTTRDIRYTYFAPNSYDNMETINHGVYHDLHNLVIESENKVPDWVKRAFAHLTQDQMSDICAFFNNHNYEDDSHIILHNKHVRSKIKELSRTIERFGAKVYTWDSNLWNYPSDESKDFDKDLFWGSHTVFETFYAWTNKLSSDGHWSPNGNLLAAHFFKYCILNNIHTMTVQELAHWYLSYGKVLKDDLEYIEFQSVTLNDQ